MVALGGGDGRATHLGRMDGFVEGETYPTLGVMVIY